MAKKGKKKRNDSDHKTSDLPSTAQSVLIPAIPGNTATASYSLLLRVRVQPGCSHSEVTLVSPSEVRIRLGAQPTDGQANAELIRFAAKTFGLRKADVELVSGSKAREKTLKISGGITEDAVWEKLHSSLL